MSFVRTLLKDKQASAIVKAIKKHAGKYGEDHDEFLGYILGAVSRSYKDPAKMILTLESLKIMFIQAMTNQGINYIIDKKTEENVRPT